jgi:two-component system chemotaxis response regulator CheY
VVTVTDEISSEDMEALLAECRERLDAVEADLVALAEKNVEPSADFVNRVFRGLHSVKGAAGYLGCDPLKELSHLAESVLAEARDGHLALSSSDAEVLLSAVDRMNQMVAGREPQPDIQFRKELASLNAILSPLAKAPLPELKPGKMLPARDDLTDPPHQRRLRVLVVEDDFVCRLVLQGLLSKYGECHIAVNGREAIEAFRVARQAGRSYDLICLDVRMPEMDGTEALEQIRAIETTDGIFLSRVRVFMTTSARDMKTVFGSFKLICDAYLIKPIDGHQLEEHLRSFALIDRSLIYK